MRSRTVRASKVSLRTRIRSRAVSECCSSFARLAEATAASRETPARRPERARGGPTTDDRMLAGSGSKPPRIIDTSRRRTPSGRRSEAGRAGQPGQRAFSGDGGYSAKLDTETGPAKHQKPHEYVVHADRQVVLVPVDSRRSGGLGLCGALESKSLARAPRPLSGRSSAAGSLPGARAARSAPDAGRHMEQRGLDLPQPLEVPPGSQRGIVEEEGLG
jgi:hypothetical protein